MRCQRNALAAAALLLGAARAGAGADFPVSRRLVADTLHARVYEVSFPSAVKSPWPRNDTVWGTLMVPKGRKRPPVALILPIMAAPNDWIEQRFAWELARRGVAAFWIQMPTQLRRAPIPGEPSGQVFLARRPERLAANFRQSVSDARRALDVLARDPDVDGSRAAVLGVSLGAMVGAAAFSEDPRPAAALFCLGGADFARLVEDSAMTRPLLRRLGFTREELAKAFAGLDPLQHRGEEPRRPVFLVNARSDRVVPPYNARRLAQAFPGSSQLWVPGGHYTSILHMLWIPSYAALKLAPILER
ncbi:MAG: hypothetical protein KGL53_09260 [Elusimicrobia bacterium]|nr:hypothetical protein [Elusimicrobiota bacterium]